MDLIHAEFVHGSVWWRFGTLAGKTKVNIQADDLNRFEYFAQMLPEPNTRQSQLDVSYSVAPPSLVMLRDQTDPALIFVTADCPVDAHHTWRHARQYFMPKIHLPGLAKIGGWLLLQWFWYWIFKRQDLPIVRSQISPLGWDELLRPDMGMASYRKIYQRLLREALAQEDRLPSIVRQSLYETLAAIKVPIERKPKSP